MLPRVIRNSVRCHGCGDVIESKHRHDFVTCSCGNVSVDGGNDYLRMLWKNDATWDDLSITEEVKL